MPETPAVLFLIFNRPQTTVRVFERIRQAKPSRLYISSDGPRAHKEGEFERVQQTRAIVEQIDWPCEVKTLFRDENVGCGRAIAGGITWFFEHEEEGIILEDDCVPDPSFFPFAAELLERYRHDDSVGIIAGSNFQFGKNKTPESYYWSRYMHCWGWATWRRMWKHFDYEVKDWPAFRDAGGLNKMFGDDERAKAYWTRRFDVMLDPELQKAEHIDAWDYQFFFACLKQGVMNAMPNVNLVQNIGFISGDATHTHRKSELAEMPVTPIQFPLVHPATKIRNAAADDFTERQQFGKRSFWKKVHDRLVYR
jgi:hypothetical protein